MTLKRDNAPEADGQVQQFLRRALYRRCNENEKGVRVSRGNYIRSVRALLRDRVALNRLGTR